MRYQRSTLTIAVYYRRHIDAQPITVRSLQVGDWHAHLYNGEDTELGEGVTVAHKSGIATTWQGLRPATAVRLLRAYQALPPCPVSDDELSERIRTGKTKEVPALVNWLNQAMRITMDVTNPQRHIIIRG
jgi:hypothetical protein